MATAIEAVGVVNYKGQDLPLTEGYFLRRIEFSGVSMLYYKGGDGYRQLGSFDPDQGEAIINRMLEDMYAHRGPDRVLFPKGDNNAI